uniref:Uncharacterized protein n=1 Tax=Romanomermis culicivorax TaxID=13658 RepID=A0A915HSU2_ROMCU
MYRRSRSSNCSDVAAVVLSTFSRGPKLNKMGGLCTTGRDECCITKEHFKANYWWCEVRGKRGLPVLRSKTSLAGRGMNGSTHVMETVCGWPMHQVNQW